MAQAVVDQGAGAPEEGAEGNPGADATIEESLRPEVSKAFEGEDIAMMPRPELALRIGQVVSQYLESSGRALNLLERRKLVSDLIDWLVRANAPASKSKAPDLSVPEVAGDDALAKQEPKKSQSAAGGLSTNMMAAKKKIHPLVMDRLDISAASQLPREELQHQVSEIVNEVAFDEKLQLNMTEQKAIVDVMLDDMLGLGPLEPLLADDGVTDILVNGPYQVYVERGGKLELTDVKFQNDDHVMNISRRIVSQVGRRVDESSPLVDARLMDGSRVNIIIPPLAIDGSSISIRKFAKKKITLDIMARQNNLSAAMATVLKIAARSRLNILISGGTGSGKTTLLNAMSQMIDEGERIVTIEDAAELQMQQPHVVRLETRPPNLEGQGEISMRDLVKNSLRMRPDRVILGEIRGQEAVDMLQAMNTGHDGSLGTVHANRPREALTRLENMIGLAGINLPAKAVRTQIASALDMVVQISRMRDGMRRITHIEEIVGMEGDIVTTQTLYAFEFDGEGSDGTLQGRFVSSGLRPHFTPKAAYFNLERSLLEAMG